MAIVRGPFGVAVVAAAVITLVAGWSAAAPLPEGLLPQTTVTGTPVPELGAKRGVVIGFLGVGCPVARQYAVRLGEIAKRFADQGITVIGVDANPQDTADELAATGRELEVDYALLRDEGQRIARHVGATRTGGVVLLDGAGTVVYAGRVDDQFAPGLARPAPTSEELVAAIGDLLAGRPVAISRTEPVGCLITFDRPTEPTADAPTFAEAIAPLLQQHCMECHRPGEIGPFGVSDYEEVKGWSEMMVEVMEQGRMPPWHADPAHGEFRNARVLPPGTIDLFKRWIAAGHPEGDLAAIPPPPEFASGWRLPRRPDIDVAMAPAPFAVPASGTVEYQYFVADPQLDEETWISAAQVVPGTPAVVHHAIVFARPETLAEFRGTGLVSAYVPGQRATTFPPGHARRLPKRAKFVFQMHYTPIGTPVSDLSRIGLITMPADEVTHEVLTLAALEQDFEIPPGAAAHEVRAELERWPAGSTLLAVSPHMHLRGRAFRVEVVRAAGREVLLDVPRYDFNWQHTYELATPLALDDVERVEIVAVFDNSAGNPVNPAPGETVMWGDQTWEEMALAFFEVAAPRDAAGAARPRRRRTEGAAAASPAAEQRAEAFFARFDGDHDGVVTRAESARIIRDFAFASLDGDGDGRITRDEMVEAAGVRDRDR
ncbi:MAG: redoxin domain-containing protein [Planctomycetes bacterium]|nr:redoxin domain-containing protein [Planctomycetota bacterium]